MAVDSFSTCLGILGHKHKQVFLCVSCAEHDALDSVGHDQVLCGGEGR